MRPACSKDIFHGTPVALGGPMHLPRLSYILPFVVFVLGIAESPASAAWSQVLAGRVDRVAAAGDRLAAVRGTTVLLLREDGTVLGRVENAEAPPQRRRTRTRVRDEENVLDLLGIDESEQDSAWVADQLDDESTLDERRRMRHGQTDRSVLPPNFSPAVTAAGQEIWIATGRGLWRLPDQGDLLHVAGRDLAGSLLAAGPLHQLLLASGNTIWSVSGSDSTRHFIATLKSVQVVSISSSGQRMAWANHKQVWWNDDKNQMPSQILELSRPITDLKFCGEELLLLSRDGLAVISPEGVPVPRSPHLSARHLSCQIQGGPWLAIGPDLLLSFDEGHTWSSLPIPAHVRALDAAMGDGCLWLATDKGLYCASDKGLSESAHSQPEAEDSHGGSTSRQHVIGPREAGWWAAWLPRLTVRAGASIAAGRRDYQTVALATFPLDAPPPRTKSILVAENDEPTAPPQRPADLRIPPDPEADCLPLTRTKAVELAMVEPERGRSYVDRARHAAWLPELRLRMDRRLGRSESLDQPSTSTAITSPLGVDTVNDVRYEARVTWDLARLVFSNDELAAQAQTNHMAEIRRDIEVTVSRLYFERRRLKIERLPSGSGERTVGLRRELRVREIESELDALSGGSFSTCTAGRTYAQGVP
jgi:hypothetical protein